MKQLLVIATLTVSLCWFENAAADMVDQFTWSTIIPSVAQTDILGTMYREELMRQEEQARRGKQEAPSPQGSKPQDQSRVASLRYIPSKVRREANLSNFIAKVQAVDPAEAVQLQQLFADGDIIEKIQAAINSQGLRIDDLADAYTVWWVAAWEAAHGGNDTPSRVSVNAVKLQSARALAKMQALTTASDQQKQELAEALLLHAMLIDGAIDQAKGNAAQLHEVSAAVDKGAAKMGIDMHAIELTEKGFVPTKR
ncbi:DUF6683 family protein [Oryzifoliimicrobium ureilyticus]|uniref:DUF6683 family protein n=1 Tax=Oryzifoliimicrobium ureilyticus TaxID=3113724 RepID=UPI00307619F1